MVASFLVPDVDLQSGKTGNVVGKCPGILNHPHYLTKQPLADTSGQQSTGVCWKTIQNVD